MAVIIKTQDINLDELSTMENLWIYNTLDCALTFEIFESIHQTLEPEIASIYQFEKALQAPAMDMMLRGIYIDTNLRASLLHDLKTKQTRLLWILNQYSQAIWDTEFNPGSPVQKEKLLYGVLNLPPITKYDKTTRSQKTTTDRDALEKCAVYLRAKPLVHAIIAYQETTKLIGVLSTSIDADNRIRTSYNVTGTETGRWSSSGNAFGTGTNLQNITENLRQIFVADKGMKLAYIDLEGAESNIVGGIVYAHTGDKAYLDACRTGDPHTAVARLVWPHLEWTGNPAHDKKHVAGQSFYRDMSYRDIAKRGGHGTNYVGQPPTIAKHMKVERHIVEDFQQKYFASFPGIRLWHRYTANELATKNAVSTPLGRKRYFFSRADDTATLREAVAFQPQSTIADLLNLVLLKVWRESSNLQIQLLGQIHDAILIQYPESLESTVLPAVQKLMEIPLSFADESLVIRTDIMVGWNWRKQSEKNPDGLKLYAGQDKRTRNDNPFASIMDREFYPTH